MRILKIIFLLFIFNGLNAQENPFYLSIQPQAGYILKHSASLDYLNNTYPIGAHITGSWHLISDSIYQTFGVNPKVGGYLSFVDLNHKSMGYVIPVGIYFEPFFRTDKKVSFKLKAGAGLAYSSNPYDSVLNPLNMTYSMKIIGHAFFGLGVNYKVNNALFLGFTSSLHHYSNGGIKEPNKGLNNPTMAIKLDYCLNPTSKNFDSRIKIPYKNKTWYELVVFAAQNSNNKFKRKPVYGLWVNASRQVSRINALAFGSELIANYFNKAYIQQSSNQETDYKRFNLLLGHEFRMGKVVFSQHMGVYVYSPYKPEDPVYQRYGLTYYFKNRIIAGVNLKAHRHVGDFIDFRLGYAFY